MIEGFIEKESDNAILFRPADAKKAEWVPRSLIPYLSRGPVPGEDKIRVEAWKVKQMGWQDYDDSK